MSDVPQESPVPAPDPAPQPQSSPPSPTQGRALFWFSLLIFVIGAGWFLWSRYTGTPNYQAKQALSRADALAEKGDVEEAAKLYRDIGSGPSDQAKVAVDRFRDLLGGPLDRATLPQCIAVFKLAAEWSDQPDLREDLVERGLELAKSKGDADPLKGFEMLYLVMALAQSDRAQVLKSAQAISAGWTERHPDKIEVLTNHAWLLNLQGDFAAIIKLLAPVKDRLDDGQGMLQLAFAYRNQGKIDEALALLGPLCKTKLPQFRKSEAAVNAAVRPLRDQIEEGTASGFDAAAYRMADEKKKQAMKDAYIQEHLRADPQLKDVQAERNRIGSIAVPAVVGLAKIMLERARTGRDPAAQKEGLATVREYLRELRDTSGDSPDVRLLLGEIAYMKRDAKEGQQTFDDLLERTGRDPRMLYQVAQTLHRVGEAAAARKLLEEILAKESPNSHQLALLRASWHTDVADEVNWLKKASQADPKDTSTQVKLATAEARQAEQQGKDQEAVWHLRKAIGILDKVTPRSADVLADSGLLQLSLFRLSGDKAALETGVDLYEQALKKIPEDAAAMSIFAEQFYHAASVDLVKENIDLLVLPQRPGLEQLFFLFNDRAGQQEQVQRTRKHPVLRRARELAGKALEKQPENPTALQVMRHLALWERDGKTLKDLVGKVSDRTLDTEQALHARLDSYAGKHDAQARQDRKAAIERWEKQVKRLRGKKLDVSFSVAATALGRAWLRGEALGESI